MTAVAQQHDMLLSATGQNVLGFEKPPSETRVVVAMSGGVDSSVAAAMLHEQGFEVIGITLQLYDHGTASLAKGACCAGADIHDARTVAARLGIPHYVLDYESRFQDQVIDDFADSYLLGKTPIPCVRCNQTVKFEDLLKVARELKADCLATGHYVQRVNGANGAELHRGVDSLKDQSYFLFTTTAEQLDYLRFPLGGMSKDETRQLARTYGLSVADKSDSQDICFVPNGNYADVVRRLRPGAVEPGEIVHLDGTTLGAHNGVIDYTIGQRRGLGIGGRKGVDESNEPLYVVEIDPENHIIYVGPRSALACQELILIETNWLQQEYESTNKSDVFVQLRSCSPAVPAKIVLNEYSEVGLRLEQLQFGIAPGQAAVMYCSENPKKLVAGGWISKAPSCGLKNKKHSKDLIANKR